MEPGKKVYDPRLGSSRLEGGDEVEVRGFQDTAQPTGLDADRAVAFRRGPGDAQVCREVVSYGSAVASCLVFATAGGDHLGVALWL